MNIWRIFWKEARFNSGSAISCMLAVTIAVASLIAVRTALHVHDLNTELAMERMAADTSQRLATLNNDMRLATLKLSFNLVILPDGQDLHEWYDKDYSTQYMPESYVSQLATSGVVTVRHFLPSLQQRITWPETKRTIILVGTRGEVPNLHKNPVKPLVQSVPEGTIVLGHELHRSLSLEVGDTVELLGRRFTVHRCHEERGSRDDITAWISLSEAQELLDKQGKINAILALECLCAGPDGLAKVRADIAAVLPGTQVIESGSKALARAEARFRVGRETRQLLEQEKDTRDQLRSELEKMAALLIPLVVVACALWIAYLGFTNVRERTFELGILRAMGFRSRHVLLLFLGKPLVISIPGSLIGFVVGSFAGSLFITLTDAGAEVGALSAAGLSTLGLAVVAGAGLSVLAGWLPALFAVRRDPASILSRE